MYNSFEESTIKNKALPSLWQSPMTLIELEDFLQQNWEQRSVFYEDGNVESRQQFLSFLNHGNIRTNNYVGTIVFKGEQFNIFPKMFRIDSHDSDVSDLTLKHLMNNLVQWLQYCTKISYPYVNITTELDDINDLKELFITLYLRYVKDALDRSLFYRYEELTEDLSFIKGHVDYKDYYAKKYPNGIIDKFTCTYSTFEFDNILNQIIKYVCKGFVGTTSKNNQKIIRYILTKLNNVSDVRCVPTDCDRIRLSRLQKHYSVVLSMSKMFLINKMASFNLDTTESFCFLFPTEVLFEGFIGGFLQDVLQDCAKVYLQASDAYLLDEVIYKEQSLGKMFKMRHDILVEHDTKGIFILDTKYKMIDRFENANNIKRLLNLEINQQDLNQIYTYARKRCVEDVYLLYPMFRYEENESYFPLGIDKGERGDLKPVRIHFIRVPFVFEDDVEYTKMKLTRVIKQLFY